jgi:hypothetical protein
VTDPRHVTCHGLWRLLELHVRYLTSAIKPVVPLAERDIRCPPVVLIGRCKCRITIDTFLLVWSYARCQPTQSELIEYNNIFDEHYRTKASKARQTGGVILSLKVWVRPMPPALGTKLDMVRVDLHLTFGGEVTPNVEHNSTRELETTQHTVMRRVLGVNLHSIVPVRHRDWYHPVALSPG